MAPGESQSLKHVLLAKYKDDLSAQQLQSLIDGFIALPALIPHIRAFEWGTDVSVENRHQGFTHIFVLTFDSPEERDAYFVHPSHQELAAKSMPYLDKLIVVDYKASDVTCT